MNVYPVSFPGKCQQCLTTQHIVYSLPLVDCALCNLASKIACVLLLLRYLGKLLPNMLLTSHLYTSTHCVLLSSWPSLYYLSYISVQYLFVSVRSDSPNIQIWVSPSCFLCQSSFFWMIFPKELKRLLFFLPLFIIHSTYKTA